MKMNPKLAEMVRAVAREAFKDGMTSGRKHAELLDQHIIDEMAEVYAAEFECGLEVAV